MYSYLVGTVLDLPRGALLQVRAFIAETFDDQLEFVFAERAAQEQIQLHPAGQRGNAKGRSNTRTDSAAPRQTERNTTDSVAAPGQAK